MKLLRINLARMKFSKEEMDGKLVADLIGGKGLGTWFLYNEVSEMVEPLSPKNKLIFAVGPATGTSYPTANRYGVFFKSPLTGIYGESYSGGHVANRMRATGSEVFIIEGKARRRTYLVINEKGVEFRDARELWGLDTFATDDAVRRELGNRNLGVVCIGPAGENLVRFALIENDYWRSAGRGGCGAVMGSKKLKAIAFQGDKDPAIHDQALLDEVVGESLTAIKESSATSNYRNYGTLAMVDVVNEAGVFPVRYWSEGVSAHREKFNGAAMRERVLLSSRACWNCPIACGKLCEVRTGKYKGLRVEGPEYETVYAFGGLCDIGDIESIMVINDYCDRAGIDSITAGNVAAFAVEAEKRGKLKTGISMDYGDLEKTMRLLKMITEREGAGDILAEGVRRASQRLRLPGLDVTVKGLEPAGYDPRGVIGMGLAYAVSCRGACHLRSTVQVQELRGMIDRFAYDQKPQYVVDLEDRYIIFDSLIICRFIRDIATWERLPHILKALTGADLNEAKLRETANRIATLTRLFNVREGITAKDDDLPQRFFEQPLPQGGSSGNTVNRTRFTEMVNRYYELRGWDKSGKPNPMVQGAKKNAEEPRKQERIGKMRA
ncbi:MAG: aldehyde ferredoxin oxidoreductase family protein [Promethearchaeati archaeon SRVP18_Atabeyarchaeia-1]